MEPAESMAARRVALCENSQQRRLCEAYQMFLRGLPVQSWKLKSGNLREIAMKKAIVSEKAIKKITFTLAVAAALLLVLASGIPSVPTNSPRSDVFGHYGSLTPVW
jgi:hypothetical protein